MARTSKSSPTLYDRLVARLKNNPAVVVALLLMAVAGGLVKFRQDLCSLYHPLCGGEQLGSPPFATHPAVGGEWFELAFNAYMKFHPDGSVGGTYYGHTFTGSWTPLQDGVLLYVASFTESDPGIAMQWDFPVRASVQGNSMDLKWDRGSDRAVRR